MPHPLKSQISNLKSPAPDLPPGFRLPHADEPLEQWAKTVPAVQKGVLHRGKTIDVLNLRQRISVASPSYGFQVFENYFASYVACKEELKAPYRMPDGTIQYLPIIAHRINIPNDSHIDRARNSIANRWENDDLTDWLYWWDCDINLPPPMLFRLVAVALHHQLKFLCGHYAMKDIRPTFVANVKPGTRPDPQTGLVELLDGGTGAMLWHRSVLDQLREHPEVRPSICAPNSPTPHAIQWNYFSSGPYGAKVPYDQLNPQQKAALAKCKGRTFDGVPQWLSEDWKVCRLYQEQGGKVMGDTSVKLQHFGGLEFPPRKVDLYDAALHLIAHHDPDAPVEKFREALAKYNGPCSAQATQGTPQTMDQEDRKAA